LMYAGLWMFERERGEDAMAAYGELVDAPPDELSSCAVQLTAPPEEFVPEHLQGKPVLGFAFSYCGDPARGEELAAGLRRVGPAVDLVQAMPYRVFQTILDPMSPPGFRNYSTGEHLTGLTDQVVETFLDISTDGLYPLSFAILFQHGGAVSRVPDDATASSSRDAAFMIHPIGAWEDPADDEKHIGWVREVSKALEPDKTGGVYLNFMGDDDRVRAGYGDVKYERLVEIKRKYDPDNVFRFNQNIKPE
jgi:FAD/FMN-containing dehydrogenase